MGDTVTVEFLDSFARAWNLHDVETIVSMMTPGAIFLMSGGATAEGRRVSGRDELRKDIYAFFKSMPGARWNEARHFIAGDPRTGEGRSDPKPTDGRRTRCAATGRHCPRQ